MQVQVVLWGLRPSRGAGRGQEAQPQLAAGSECPLHSSSDPTAMNGSFIGLGALGWGLRGYLVSRWPGSELNTTQSRSGVQQQPC